MTEKQEKSKSGAGKFFLGAAIGAAVGAIASRFIKFGDAEEDEACKEDKEEPETTPSKPKSPKTTEKTEKKVVKEKSTK